MQDYQLGFHIARLMSDRQIFRLNRTYTLYNPSLFNRYLSEIIYVKSYEDALHEGVMTKSILMSWMLYHGHWSQPEEDKLEGLKNDLEELKCKLYELELKQDERKLVRKKIVECKELISGLIKKRHGFDNLTCEYIADSSKSRFLIGSSLYSEGPYWTNPMEDWQGEDEVIDSISMKLGEQYLSEADLRKVARSELWRAFWTTKGASLFEAISDEQINLISWTRVYNSVQEHPECPENDVIEDDDLFDGWLIKNRRQREKDFYQKKADELAARHPGASEIFVPVDESSVDKITKMNSKDAQMVKKQRFAALNQSGSLDEFSMPDTRAELEMAINRAAHGK